MQDKTVVITGATTGIGHAAARELAARGARVLLVARNQERGVRARDSIRDATDNDRVEVLLADLSSMGDVAHLAQEILERCPRLDVLVHNAAVLMGRREETTDGLERTFATNFLSPLALSLALRTRLEESAPSRVVTTGSSGHRYGRIHFGNLQLERGFRGFKAYFQSKLAVVMFSRIFGQKLQGSGVTSNAFDPGLVATRLGHDGDTGRLFEAGAKIAWPFFRTPQKGAETLVYLASSPEVADAQSGYFMDRKPARLARRARKQDVAERLWAAGEEILGKLALGPDRPQAYGKSRDFTR